MAGKILVVENEERILNILKYYLEEAGHVCGTYQDGIAAVESLERNQYALAILDIALARMDGYEVAKNIRSHDRHKEVPILFVSGKVEVPEVLRRESKGSIEFLPKPIVKKEFLAMVEKLAGKP